MPVIDLAKDVYALNSIMQFDHVIVVDEQGNVSDLESTADVYAPNLCDDELDDAAWSLSTHGYTGQFRYSGPIMHDSEFIGGRLAEDILSEPGTYVALVNYFSDDNEPEGWAVARLDS